MVNTSRCGRFYSEASGDEKYFLIDATMMLDYDVAEN